MISTEEEQAKDERDADTMELILSKSSLLEGFRREYGDLQKKYEDISLQLISQERENDSLTQELSGIREAVTFTRRNIDEVRASQESLRENIEVIASKRNILSDREKNSRDEISEFTSKFEELKTALAAGSDWTPQQKDERIALEKERDFLATKLENRTNQVSNLRSEVDRLYALIQTLEAEATSADERVEQISKRMKELRGVASSLIKKREDSETKVFESRAAVVKVSY
jgi:chromosome segregation ATPase